MESFNLVTTQMMISRLAMAALIGGLIGYERRMRHKAIGIAGMMLVAMGSASYMLLSRYLAATDPGAVGRTVQGILQGIGFLGGAVIFKGGRDVRGIKTAAAGWQSPGVLPSSWKSGGRAWTARARVTGASTA